jgi:hypothetical protein
MAYGNQALPGPRQPDFLFQHILRDTRLDGGLLDSIMPMSYCGILKRNNSGTLTPGQRGIVGNNSGTVNSQKLAKIAVAKKPAK